MKPRAYLLFGSALTFLGCTVQGPGGKTDTGGGPESVPGETGIALSAVVGADNTTDVAFIEYGIDRVACIAGEQFDPVHRATRVELESMMLPGGIPAWENSPLDRNSQHQFADHFEVLPAGCYDVTASPLASSGDASADCSAAIDNDVAVDDGYTTEIFLITQCKGAPAGSIDAVAALNQPPELTGLTFTPSKFIKAGGKVTVCATANDPNGDPLDFGWDQIGGSLCGDTVISTKKEGNDTTQCVDLTPPEAGDYLFQIKVYDMIHDENNKLVRVEDWLKAHGYPNSSHDALRFPVYVGTASGLPEQ